MKNHLEIIKDIERGLEKESLTYELRSLKNVMSTSFNTSSELIGSVGELLVKMVEKQETKNAIGQQVNSFLEFAAAHGLTIKPSHTYSLEQKTFEIDGRDFSDLKEFFNTVGEQLVANNEWEKNLDALNDILIGGFGKTESGEPFKFIWKNSDLSRQRLVDFNDVIEIFRGHEHIDLELK